MDRIIEVLIGCSYMNLVHSFFCHEVEEDMKQL